MPKVQWTGLPLALRDHLFERLRERKITAEDLYLLIRRRFCSESYLPKGKNSRQPLELACPGIYVSRSRLESTTVPCNFPETCSCHNTPPSC